MHLGNLVCVATPYGEPAERVQSKEMGIVIVAAFWGPCFHRPGSGLPATPALSSQSLSVPIC